MHLHTATIALENPDILKVKSIQLCLLVYYTSGICFMVKRSHLLRNN